MCCMNITKVSCGIVVWDSVQWTAPVRVYAVCTAVAFAAVQLHGWTAAMYGLRNI
jgi:hypothetical protein